MAFVIRIEVEEREPKNKVFGRKTDAEAYFRALSPYVWDESAKSVALFSVDGIEDAREAIAAVEAGDKKRVTLLDREPKPLPELDLSDLGL